jgi:hypothetical protein
MTRLSKLLKNKVIFNGILLAIVLILISIFSLIFFKTGKASLTIIVGEQKRTFEGPIFKNMSLLEAVQAAALGGNFDISFSKNELGQVEFSKIDGGQVSNKKTWHFFLNGRPVDASRSDRIYLKPDDKVEAKYE